MNFFAVLKSGKGSLDIGNLVKLFGATPVAVTEDVAKQLETGYGDLVKIVNQAVVATEQEAFLVANAGDAALNEATRRAEAIVNAAEARAQATLDRAEAILAQVTKAAGDAAAAAPAELNKAVEAAAGAAKTK